MGEAHDAHTTLFTSQRDSFPLSCLLTFHALFAAIQQIMLPLMTSLGSTLATSTVTRFSSTLASFVFIQHNVEGSGSILKGSAINLKGFGKQQIHCSMPISSKF